MAFKRTMTVLILAVLLALPKISLASTFMGLGSGMFHAYAVSDDGSTVVGEGHSTTGGHGAYRWTQSSGMQLMGDGIARGVSADGSVIVGDNNSMAQGAFRWTESEGRQLIASPGVGGAWGVSSDGTTVAGWGMSSNGTEAFRWTQSGGTQWLGALPGGNYSGAFGISNDGSTIVGNSAMANGSGPFRWTESSGMQSLAGTVSSWGAAYDASADGTTIVGTGDIGAFRWTEAGGMQDLGFTDALGVSGDGSMVVGHYGSSDAMIWTETDGAQKITDILLAEGIDITGWILSSATAISADGLTIVGNGSLNGSLETWMVTLDAAPTPIPGAIWLLGSGLVGLVGLRKKFA